MRETLEDRVARLERLVATMLPGGKLPRDDKEARAGRDFEVKTA